MSWMIHLFSGLGGGYNERENVEYRSYNSDEDEYDKVQHYSSFFLPFLTFLAPKHSEYLKTCDSQCDVTQHRASLCWVLRVAFLLLC
jgi:hypothetical protein